jgi:hypothetical protein
MKHVKSGTAFGPAAIVIRRGSPTKFVRVWNSAEQQYEGWDIRYIEVVNESR